MSGSTPRRAQVFVLLRTVESLRVDVLAEVNVRFPLDSRPSRVAKRPPKTVRPLAPQLRTLASDQKACDGSDTIICGSHESRVS
jgi:hypothetical protein